MCLVCSELCSKQSGQEGVLVGVELDLRRLRVRVPSSVVSLHALSDRSALPLHRVVFRSALWVGLVWGEGGV